MHYEISLADILAITVGSEWSLATALPFRSLSPRKKGFLVMTVNVEVMVDKITLRPVGTPQATGIPHSSSTYTV
jgi:hypothetical protein